MSAPTADIHDVAAEFSSRMQNAVMSHFPTATEISVHAEMRLEPPRDLGVGNAVTARVRVKSSPRAGAMDEGQTTSRCTDTWAEIVELALAQAPCAGRIDSRQCSMEIRDDFHRGVSILDARVSV